MPEYTISSVTLVDDAEHAFGKDQNLRLLALLDVRVRGIDIQGFGLLRRKNGQLVLSMPRIESMRGKSRSVYVEDAVLRRQIIDGAHAIYAAMGGQFADAAMSSELEHDHGASLKDILPRSA